MLHIAGAGSARVHKTAAAYCSLGLSALISGGTSTVLVVGNPLRSDAPILTSLATASVVTAFVLFRSRGLPRTAQLRFATANLLTAVPLVGMAIGTLTSDEVAQLTTRSSSLGWVLASMLPLVAMIAARRADGASAGIDPAFGGAVGVAGAALLHLAATDASAFSPPWALAGFTIGAVVVAGISRLPPQPPRRTPVGTTWRTLPCTAALVMAVITAVPAAPRHELATSAGAQALAVTVTSFLLVASIALWWGERNHACADPWNRFRITVRLFLPVTTALSLLVIGGLQAASYSAVTIDDLGRFLVTAEALLTSREFQFWGSYWLLPGLPVFLAIAFALLGYTYPAALAPMFLANALLPWLIYRAALALGARKAPAYAFAVIAVIIPPIQIYSLGSAEPDPVFIALLAATAWAFAHAIRSRRPSFSLLALGALGAAVVLMRPEGPLYSGLLVLAALLAVRSRWAVVGSLAFGALLLPLVVYSLAQLGRPWPAPGEEFSYTMLVHKADIIGEVTLPRLSKLLLLHDIRFPLIIAAILILFAIGSVRTSRQHWALAALPLAAILNVVLTLSIVDSSTTEIRISLVEDFVRHRAYPLPIVAALAAVGVSVLVQLPNRNPTLNSALRIVGVAAVIYLAAGSLYILGKPEGFHHGPDVGSLLPADIHVNAPELWLHPFRLPAGDGDFMGYRGELFAWYKPFDTHSKTIGMAYQTLTGAVASFGFASILAAAPQRRSRISNSGV